MPSGLADGLYPVVLYAKDKGDQRRIEIGQCELLRSTPPNFDYGPRFFLASDGTQTIAPDTLWDISLDEFGAMLP